MLPVQHQVLRNSRLRVGAPGSHWACEERNTWRSEAEAFVANRSAAVAKGGPGKVRAVKKQAAIPRLASLDWIMALENVLVCAVGIGLAAFVEHKVLALNVLPKTLTLCMDYCGSN